MVVLISWIWANIPSSVGCWLSTTTTDPRIHLLRDLLGHLTCSPSLSSMICFFPGYFYDLFCLIVSFMSPSLNTGTVITVYPQPQGADQTRQTITVYRNGWDKMVKGKSRRGPYRFLSGKKHILTLLPSLNNLLLTRFS